LKALVFDEPLSDQFMAEAFYRIQLSENLAVTPSVRLIVDTALDPTKDAIGLFGLRGRVTI
jgi:porin